MQAMNIMRAFLAPVAVLAFALPAQAAKISLADLSAYLNSLTTLQAEFTQVNADGSIGTGTLYIKRPGRARFEYAPPDKSLVIAGGSEVAIFDPKSSGPAQSYPLNRTPLSLILASKVNLGQAKMVVKHSESDGKTIVRAQDPAHPEYGTIDMVFTANPVALRQWVITDDSGSQTTVILGAVKLGGNLNSGLFNITVESERRGN